MLPIQKLWSRICSGMNVICQLWIHYKYKSKWSNGLKISWKADLGQRIWLAFSEWIKYSVRWGSHKTTIFFSFCLPSGRGIQSLLCLSWFIHVFLVTQNTYRGYPRGRVWWGFNFSGLGQEGVVILLNDLNRHSSTSVKTKAEHLNGSCWIHLFCLILNFCFPIRFLHLKSHKVELYRQPPFYSFYAHRESLLRQFWRWLTKNPISMSQ